MNGLNFKVYEEINDVVIGEIDKLQKIIFDEPYAADAIENRLKTQSCFLSVHAYDGDEVIGFKVGYGAEGGIFYSWLGGVLSDWRRKGIAHTLMSMQHEYAQNLGFLKIRTKSQNEFKAMTIVNLLYGFDIVSTLQDRERGLQIVFEKVLN